MSDLVAPEALGRLVREAAHPVSTLPEGPTARSALNDLLVRLRTRSDG